MCPSHSVLLIHPVVSSRVSWGPHGDQYVVWAELQSAEYFFTIHSTNLVLYVGNFYYVCFLFCIFNICHFLSLRVESVSELTSNPPLLAAQQEGGDTCLLLMTSSIAVQCLHFCFTMARGYLPS